MTTTVKNTKESGNGKKGSNYGLDNSVKIKGLFISGIDSWDEG